MQIFHYSGNIIGNIKFQEIKNIINIANNNFKLINNELRGRIFILYKRISDVFILITHDLIISLHPNVKYILYVHK